MLKIAFHSNQLCLRGTEIALYTYADYNEKILGNKSVIFSSPNGNLDAYEKFKNRFEVNLMNFGSYEHHMLNSGIDYMYAIKGGNNDGLCLSEIPTLVHAVFRSNDPHGHRYAYVSDWLSKDQGYDPLTHSVPHIVEKFPDGTETLREELNIPNEAMVFGCYGGSTEFNIGFVHDAIKRTVNSRDGIYFLFMNINKFTENHKNIIHLPGTSDLNFKSKFVRSCDAMLHARSGGETFGLAVGEFSMENKPVLTYKLSGESHHIDVLGDRGLYYSGFEEVYDILNNIKNHIKHDDYYKLYEKFSPEIIMQKFKDVFLS